MSITFDWKLVLAVLALLWLALGGSLGCASGEGNGRTIDPLFKIGFRSENVLVLGFEGVQGEGQGTLKTDEAGFPGDAVEEPKPGNP